MARTPERFLLEARRSTKPLAILIVLIFVSLIFGAIIANKLTFQRPWLSYRQVKAEFDDVKGIFPGGDSVRIHGVVAVRSTATRRCASGPSPRCKTCTSTSRTADIRARARPAVRTSSLPRRPRRPSTSPACSTRSMPTPASA
jgi:hypothetical protein